MAIADEHRALGVDRPRLAIGFARRRAEPWHEQLATAQRQLWLSGGGGQRRGEAAVQLRARLDVEQAEAIRVLDLSGGHQSPKRRRRRTDGLFLHRRDRVAGEQHQPGGSEALLGDPLLQQLERGGRGVERSLGTVARGGAFSDDELRGCGRDRGDVREALRPRCGQLERTEDPKARPLPIGRRHGRLDPVHSQQPHPAAPPGPQPLRRHAGGRQALEASHREAVGVVEVK